MKRRLTVGLMTLLGGLLVPGASSNLSAQGALEGIKVHGHWAIDIRQPDGTLVSHREFENALEPSGGSRLLVYFLTRSWSPGEWLVDLWTNERAGLDKPCLHSNGVTAVDCVIAEPTYVRGFYTDATIVNNLVVANLDPAIKLSGSHTAARNGYITFVDTLLALCNSQRECAGASVNGGPLRFTSATLAPPISVVAGQIIQVTVVISFS